MATSTHLFRRTSTHPFGRGWSPIYLSKEGWPLIYLSRIRWQPIHLRWRNLFIYLSIYLLTDLRGNGYPPDYVGGNATCTHLCRREWSPVYLSREEWPLILSIYLSTEGWAPIYQPRIGWAYPFILEDRIYLSIHPPMYLSWRRWPTLPTYLGRWWPPIYLYYKEE